MSNCAGYRVWQKYPGNPVILSAAKNLVGITEILRRDWNDKERLPHPGYRNFASQWYCSRMTTPYW
jgi:hypothetical protein